MKKYCIGFVLWLNLFGVGYAMRRASLGLNMSELKGIKRDPSLSELDALVITGGKYCSMRTDDTWRMITQKYISDIVHIANSRLGGALSSGFDKQVLAMIERERAFDACAFYHGCSARYAIFLRLNQLLYEKTTGKKFPADMQLLRVRGARPQLDGMTAQYYRPIDAFADDCSMLVREELLSVSYTPFAGLIRPEYGPLHYTANKLSLVEPSFARHIRQLLQSYGYDMNQRSIDLLIDGFRPRFGMMLQIMAAPDIVDQLAYNAQGCGVPAKERAVSEATTSLVIDSWERLAKHAGVGDLAVHDAIFEKQARLLLCSKWFDEPNDQTKIFMYHSLSSAEQDLLEKICAEILKQACPVVDALREKKSRALAVLFGDLRQYHVEYSAMHEGDLYEHSLWTVNALEQLCDAQHEWAHDLTENDFRLLRVAALLHDIGHAGIDLSCGGERVDHAAAAVEYLNGKKKYHLRDGSLLDMDSVLHELSVAPTDRALLGVLVLAHTILPGDVTTSDELTQMRTFMHDIHLCCEEAGYCGVLDQRLVHMIALLHLANVHARRFIDKTSPWLRSLVGSGLLQVRARHSRLAPLDYTEHDERKLLETIRLVCTELAKK